MSRLSVLGVPTGAGGNCPGMEYAPMHLRRLGLIERLSQNGAEVLDHGDLPFTPFTVDCTNPRSRNVDAVAAVALRVKRKATEFLTAGSPFLMIGGDCTITVGAAAAFRDQRKNFGLLYVDGHTDLNLPETSHSGIMDGMGAAHMLGLGHETLLSVCRSRPMLQPDQLVFLGIDKRRRNEPEVELLKKFGPHVTYVDDVVRDASAAFRNAAGALSSLDHVVVHVDIDVLHFPEFPFAHVPEYDGLGISLKDLECILLNAFGMPNFAGCIFTEINPDRDKQGRFGDRLISAIANAAHELRPSAAGAETIRP